MWAIHVEYEGDIYEAEQRSTQAAAERYARLWRSRGFDASVAEIQLMPPPTPPPSADGERQAALTVGIVTSAIASPGS